MTDLLDKAKQEAHFNYRPRLENLRHGHFIDCKHCRETIYLAQLIVSRKYRAFDARPDADGYYTRHTCSDGEE